MSIVYGLITSGNNEDTPRTVFGWIWWILTIIAIIAFLVKVVIWFWGIVY
jgi:hypothetical protein